MQIFLFVGSVLVVVKSAYNGYVRRWVEALDMIPEIKGKAEDIEQHQEDQTDAIVALSATRKSDRLAIDHDALVSGLRDDTGSERFLREEGMGSDGDNDGPCADGGERWEDERDGGKEPREA